MKAVILNGNKVVAHTVINESSTGFADSYYIVANIGIEEFELPIALFGFGRLHRRKVSKIDFIKWLGNRIFPEERDNCEELLKRLGKSKYNINELSRMSKGAFINDEFWVDFLE